MLGLLQPRSMYPPSAIQFCNPLPDTSRYHTCHNNLDISSPLHRPKDFSLPLQRPITPPPDMNTIAPHVQHPRYAYYGDRSATSANHETEVSYNQTRQSQVLGNTQSKPEVIPQSSTRPRSPIFTQVSNAPAPRRDSQTHSIAPALQIPRSVNNTQGSLAELAAQVS